MAKKKSSFSSLDEFKQSILDLNQLMTDKIAKIRIFSNGIVHIGLDEQRYERIKKLKLDKKRLKQLLNTEIPAVISAVLQDAPSLLFRLMSPTEFQKKGVREEFDKKIDIVKKKLITSNMRQRSLLRGISKNNILDEIKWDIGIKCHDLEKGSIEKLQFATLQFVCNTGSAKGLPDGIFSVIFGPNRTEKKTLTIDIHLEDLEQLIDDLILLKNNLSKFSSENKE